MNLPKVLIGGFPRSGTSFLCNLVVEMGFNPGNPQNLKPADKDNLWGYWEHLSIRDLTWRAVFRHPKGGRGYTKQGFFQQKVLGWNHPMAARVQEVAIRDNVEVYKDTMLPLIYRLFPKICKCIVIVRSPYELYEYRKARWSYQTCVASWLDYRKLTQKMMNDVSCLIVDYDNFKRNFDEQVASMAWYLGIDVDITQLRHIFKTGRN